jgi:uracil-DNA glycosylase family 4
MPVDEKLRAVHIPQAATQGRRVRRYWREHRECWQECEKCPLHKTRNEAVLGRGVLPADVLFIGEAPGQKEDFYGYPFVGASGELLQKAIEAAPFAWFGIRYFIINTVACRPPLNRPPTFEEKTTCSPRVREVLKISKARAVILVGKEAQESWRLLYDTKKTKRFRVLNAPHPAYLLRRGGVKSREYKAFVKDLTSFARSLV